MNKTYVNKVKIGDIPVGTEWKKQPHKYGLENVCFYAPNILNRKAFQILEEGIVENSPDIFEEQVQLMSAEEVVKNLLGGNLITETGIINIHIVFSKDPQLFKSIKAILEK